MNHSKPKKTFIFIAFLLVFIPFFVHAEGVINLPRTGQAVCYDTAGATIACAGTGQDGDIKAGVAWPGSRYTNNLDTTVTDNLTGLIWTKDTAAPNVGACTGGAGTWQAALDYVACLSNNGYLGHNDWRLPDINELESLFTVTPSPWLGMNAYWSSTTVANSTDRAWSVSGYAIVLDYVKATFTNGNIKPVRGQPGTSVPSPVWKTGQTAKYAAGDDGDLQKGVAWPSPRFADNNDETVTDNLTGLIWTKDANAPGSPQCTPGNERTWQQALDYVKCLNTNLYRSHNDWRLPNRKELLSLIDRAAYNPALPANHPFVNVQLKDYWTSTTHTQTANAWNISMVDGYVAYDPKTGPYTPGVFCYAWPVRGGETGSAGAFMVLTVAKSGAGSGTVTADSGTFSWSANTGTASYNSGISVTLTATASSGSTFAGWSGSGCSGTGTCTVVMDAAKSVTATFNVVATQQFTLTVAKSGSGLGNVISSPAGIDCGSACSAAYDSGVQVTLTAQGASGSTFAGWSGSGCSGTGTCTVAMDAAKSVTATFILSLGSPADVDGNGKIELADAIAVLRIISGRNLITPMAASADVNGDHILGAAEAIYVLQTISGLRSVGALTGGVFSSGDFKVTVAEGTMPTGIHAISPQAKPETTVPVALPLKTNETNITAGAKAYTLNLAENGFFTTASGVVAMEVPFDPALVPDPATPNSLSIYLKILDSINHVAIPVPGRIEGSKIIAELRGLPPTMTVVVVYCPNMTGVTASDDGISPTAMKPEETSYTLEAKKWHIVFDETDTDIKNAVKTFLKLNTDPTPAEMKDVIKKNIGGNAITAANLYHNEGFRSPNLIAYTNAKDPGWEELGTTPRYILHFIKNEPIQGGDSTSFVPDNVIDSRGNYFGSIYIEAYNLNDTREKDGDTVFGAIAHEMFHAIQSGYEDIFMPFYGIIEGSATCYGETMEKRLLINALATPSVRIRPGHENVETFMLSYSLLEQDTSIYANQDFFVYFGRRYGNNSLEYLKGLLGQLHLDAGPKGANFSNTDFDKNRKIVLDSVDLLFRNYSVTLKDAYLDFVRQRAMEHNEESRFGRTNETITGLAENIFETAFTFNRTVDPLTVQQQAVSHINIGSLSSSAIRIKPSSVIPVGGTGATLTITVTANGEVVGETLAGTVYYKNRPPAPLQFQNTFADFGTSASDEIVILLSNLYFGRKGMDVNVDITGTSGTGPGAQGASLDTLHTTQYVAFWLTAGVAYSDNTTGEGFAVLPYLYKLDPTMSGSLSWNDRTFSQTMVLGTDTITLNGTVSPDGNRVDLTVTENDAYDFPTLFKSELSKVIVIAGLPFETENAATPLVTFTKTGPGAQSLTSVNYTKKTTYYDDNSVKTVTIRSIDWSNAELKAVFGRY